MSNSQPVLEPPSSQSGAESGAAGSSMPSLSPPSAGGSGGGTDSGGGSGDSVGGAGAVATWLNDKRVSGLWAINQNRNSWAYVAGVGWKRLSDASDSAVVALTILSAHAKNGQTPYNYREEADAKIHEIYAW